MSERINSLKRVGKKTCRIRRTKLLNLSTSILVWEFAHYLNFERLNDSKLQRGKNWSRRIKRSA